MPIPRKIKPWRGFPSVNAVHGIRARVQQSSPNAGRGEFRFTATGASGSRHIGTYPAGSMLVGITQKIETAFSGTTPTASFGSTAGGAELSALAAITAQGTTERTIVTTLGVPTADVNVYLSLGGTPDFVTGAADFLVRFYVNKD